jgi:hypothetical protein
MAMRFPGLSSALIIFNTLVVPAVTSRAQAPAAPKGFDGKYVGTATLTHGVSCPAINSVDMTITGGQAVIHETHLDGAGLTYLGSVNAAGEL